MNALSRLACVLSFLPVVLWAQEPPSKPALWPLPDLDFFLKEMTVPPVAGSPADVADLNYTQAVQAGADADTIREATIVAIFFDVFSFAQVLGPNFTPEKYPQTAAFFKKLEATTNAHKNKLKDHFARPRPVDAHADVVKALVPYEAGYSYPSGHAARSWLYALVLGQLDPGDRLAMLREAGRVGYLRVLGGMHYQSDIIASRTFAELLYTQLMKDPEFTQALATLKAAEWKTPPAVETK